MVKSIQKKASVHAAISVFTLVALCLAMSGAPSAGLRAQTAPSQNFPIINPPPFDFNDAFYTANGIDVNQLDSPAAGRFGLFRRTGPPAIQNNPINWKVDNTNTDPDRTNVRILATTGGYIDDGTGAPTQFISIIAFVLNQNFFTGVANKRGIQMVDIVGAFEAYAAPRQFVNGVFAGTACGTMGDGTTPCFPVTSVATPNLRQDWRFSTNRSPIDGTSPFGYFCDDILGMWIITYFWYTNAGFGPHQTSQCGQMLAALGVKNGLSLDGTPIIKTADELNFLEGSRVGSNPIPGFSGQQPPKPGCTAEGQENVGGADGGAVWLICPAIPDPRNGGIAPDAFLDVVRLPSGSPLDPAFLNNFNCLQITGKFCNE